MAPSGWPPQSFPFCAAEERNVCEKDWDATFQSRYRIPCRLTEPWESSPITGQVMGHVTVSYTAHWSKPCCARIDVLLIV